MSLNVYIFSAAAIGLLLSPLLAPFAPLLWLWSRRQLAEKKRRGYAALWPFMASTLELYAEAMIAADPEELEFSHVARNIDRYISETRSPRIWRVRILLALMEFSPWLVLQRRFSHLNLVQRREFCDRFLRSHDGIWGLVSMSKQLVRLGFYASPRAQRYMGFVPMSQRGLRVGDGPAASSRVPALAATEAA